MAKDIGILSLAESPYTGAFQALQDGLLNHYYFWQYSLHFGLAKNDEAQLGPCADALLGSVQVIVADGAKARQVVQGKDANMKIVQAVGAEFPPHAHHTGFHLNATAMCKAQLDTLIKKYPALTDVTVLVYDPTNSNNAANNPVYTALANHNGADPKKKKKLKPLVASTVAQLQAYAAADVVGSFMLIPNAIFFNKCKFIAGLVDGQGLPAIYPELEYKNAHTNQTDIWVLGHNILTTFKKAADHVYNFLEGHPMHQPSEADRYDDTL